MRNFYELGKYLKTKPLSRSVECEKSNTNYIHYGDIHGKFKGFINEDTDIPFIKDIEEFDFLRNGDLIFADASEDYKDLGKTVYMEETNNRKIISGLHTHAFRPNAKIVNPLFLKYFTDSYLFRKEMHKRGQGISVLGISKKEIDKIQIKLLNLEIQNDYASGLRNIDEKINLTEQKIENLKLFKKGIIQKLFPKNNETKPKLRVSGYTDDWKLAKVGELLVERNDKLPKSDEYPLMAFIAHFGVVEKGERFNREFLVKNEDDKKYKKTEYGDFIYSSNNLTTGSIGLNKYGNATISPVYSIFSPTNRTSSEFISNILIRDYFINQMIRYRQGVVYGQWRIHEKDFLKIEIRIPDIDEQNDILKLIRSLDEKIRRQEKNLEILKQFTLHF